MQTAEWEFMVVNTKWQSAQTRVNLTARWKRLGSGGGSGGGGVISRTGKGEAYAQTGELIVMAEPAAVPVGEPAQVAAYASDWEGSPAVSDWTVWPAPDAWFVGGSVGVSSVQVQRNTPGEAVVSAVYRENTEKTGDATVTFVAVTGITAQPSVVGVGGDVAYGITTEPPGYGRLVTYVPADVSTPGVKTVTAVCGSSSAQCEVTVVGIKRVVCEEYNVSSETDDPDEPETVYTTWTNALDEYVELIAVPEPVVPWPEGWPVWEGAEQDAEDRGKARVPRNKATLSVEESDVRASCGTSAKAARVIVARLNLEYDNLPEEWAVMPDEPNELVPGGFLGVNDNDNAGGANPGEGNATPDNLDSAPLAYPDPDLRPIKLILQPSDLEHGVVTLSVPDEGGPLRAWADGKKNATPKTWDFDEGARPPAEVYIEGYAPGVSAVSLSFAHAEKLALADTVNMNVIKIDSVEVYCDKFGASGSFGVNPEIFAGGQTDFGQQDQPPPYWWLPGTYANPSSRVLKVFFKYIKDSNDEPDPFDIDLKANILPESIPDEDLNITWVNWAGPSSSGSFDKTDEREVKFQNPTKGGLYKFRMEMEIQPYHIMASDAWVLLPKAGGEIADWMVSEVPSLVTRASSWETAVRSVAVAHSLDEDEFLETAWKAIATCDFDYQGIVGYPTKRYSFRDSDRPAGHTPDPSIPGMAGEKGNGDWDEPSYATLAGIVVHRAKINNAMYAVWGRELGYSTAFLQGGAIWNAMSRGLWDDSTSQNAVVLGGDLYDAHSSGGNLSALLTKTRARTIQSSDTPSGLNDVNLWPDTTPVSSGFWLPTMPTDYDSLDEGENEIPRGRLF